MISLAFIYLLERLHKKKTTQPIFTKFGEKVAHSLMKKPPACNKGKGKVKVHTLDIAPFRSESPPQMRSGMARVLKGFHSFTCTPTRSSAIGMSHTCLCLPSRSWYSFIDPEGWKAE